MLKILAILFSVAVFPVSSIVNRGNRDDSSYYDQRGANGEYHQFHDRMDKDLNGSPHPAFEDKPFFWDESHDRGLEGTETKHQSGTFSQRADHETPFVWKDSSDDLGKDSRVHVIKEESHSVKTQHYKTEQDDYGASGYGSYQADGWRPIKSSKQGGRSYSSYSKASKKGGAFVSGSCETRLTAPMNSVLRCSSYSGCQATCLRDYQFPNGETQLFFACQEGKWRVRGSTDDEIPQCHPSCLPPCQNGGICTSPNTCQCSQTFFGPYCQYEKKACTDTPPTPNNAKKICNSESCTIQCLANHQFSDGSAIANLFCKEGVWIPGRPDWKTIPDCKPVCSPPCLNGGSCMSNNLCQCPQQYRGSQCQYSVDVCDARKLNFNGNYNCSGTGDYFSCSLTCPLGMSFASNAAIGQVYTCDYSTGSFTPSVVPQCVFGAGVDPNSNYLLSSHTMETINTTKKTETSYGYLDLNKLFVLEKKPPTAGSCSIWGGAHYKTFDGSIVSFKSGCLYTLVSDLKDNKFHVQTQNTETDCLGSGCTRSFNIYINDILYRLLLNDAGMPEVRMSLQNFSVPSQLPDLRVDISGKMVITTMQSLNVKMVWNQKDLVDVEVGEELWNSTGGLCGTMDGHSTNDLTEYHESVVEYAEKWSVETFGEVCQSKVVDVLECGDAETQKAAHEFCNKIMVDPKFKQCRNTVMVREFYDACRWDFCACKMSSQGATNCACESIEMFVKECAKKGITDIATWRDSTFCPMQCSGGKIYMSCGPTTEATCRSQQNDNQLTTQNCEEGCFCPEGTLLEDGHCILSKDCPCQLRGKTFKAGATVPSDCNTCTCVNGQWSCTDLLCTARCEAVGDPHYRTFDGRHYDFMGKCSYHLLKTDNYSISAENVACDGSISEAFGYSPSKSPSCTKAVTVLSNDGKTVIKLKQNKLITVNGEDVTMFPLMINDIYIRAASSIFVQVELPDEINVLWDGFSRVYIHVSPNLKGKTQGLCGTFNGMQKDDFMTPEGDIEQDISSFADKWKAKETCDNISDKEDLEKVEKHPCDVKVQNRELAEAYCSNLTSRLFADCHMFVDPMPYYQNCLYDLCSCRSRKMSECFCPMLAAYAKQCADQGAIVEWRSKVRECGLQCSGGQVYTVCGDSCTRTCQDIAGRNRACRKECVDGCNCPEGRALDSRGDCVPISSCHCLRDGMEYPPGHKDIQRSSKGLKLCKCESGAWNCKLATQEEIEKYPNEALEHKITCSSKKFQDFTHCLPAEPITCKNMHNYHNLQSSSAICRPGCVCKRGFVLDSLTKECVKPTQCPCHHGGKSYADGEEIKESCNKCTCKASKWQCTEHLCPSVCTTWGDSHFKTFDGKFYDFQGACDYVLSKGMISVNESFTLTLEIVPCGTTGVSCPKSVILTVHSGDVHESIQFSKHKPIPSHESLKKITVREAGLFIFADVIDLGIVVQWDKGTRVTVKADLKWKNRLKGLCGNYNDNEADDFQTPAGGIAEVSSTTFGDSWKLHSYCPEAFAVKDTCEVHPNRRSWAIEKCGILKSPIFKPCHSEVPVELYLDRCIFDTCGCDQGGDCECLCTAIAAYAEQCNLEGVPIKWRNQQLCPMQCDEKCSEYKACTQTCPIETCDNLLTHAKLSQLCRQDSCVEGCERKPCPAGHIYQNTTSYECIPVALCKPICRTEDGQEYYEGDIVEQDACHTCFCSHHKKVCTGTPCTTEVILSSTSFLNLTTMTVTTTTIPPEVNVNDQLVCVSGWTEWINKHHPSLKEPNFDFENASAIDIMNQISQPIDFFSNNIMKPQCGKNEMIDIQCREVETKKHYKELGQDVECTIDGGLICSDPNKCNDYEIRVLCHCNDSVTITSETTTPSSEVELLRCNSTHPLAKHPTNCFKYFQCEETSSGSFMQVERECSSNLWFNPESLTCDWPNSVLKLRPECEQITETTNNNLGCVDTWSDWLNISNPRNSGGDFELLSVMQREHMNICKNNGYIKDIECQFLVETVDRTRSGKYNHPIGDMSNYVEYHDIKDSPDVDVTCDKNLGLECVNDKQSSKMCQDYRIRILCACEEKKEEQMNEKAHEQAPVTETVYQDCRSDEVYNDCLIKCDQLCHYYEHTLPRYTEYCSFKSRKQCLPGCSSLSNPVNCSTSGQRWRDFSSCVSINDCTCRSHNGTLVKPGQVLWESNCEACQCLNNHYVCDTSECLKTTIHPSSHSATYTTAPSTLESEIRTTTESHSTHTEDISFTTLSETYESTRTTQNIFILSSTVSPPPFCNKYNYKPLLGGEKEVQLTASSNSNFSVPEYGILVENNEKNWKPIINNQEQHLEINLGQVTPVYSIITAGDEHSGEFVTSYYVLYSSDGQTFSYVMDGAEPQLFRGPLTSLLTMQQEFKSPVEGRYFRINPNSWKEGIAIRVQLFGCSNQTIRTQTTILPTKPTDIPTSTAMIEPVCSDKMGVESGALKAEQISVSSHLDENFKAHHIALNSDLGWAPLVDSLNQWVQFDFLEERTITGVETKGGSVLVDGKRVEPAWVESYKIAYSHDGSEWNFIMQEYSQLDHPVKKIFIGNFDEYIPNKNFFHLPIHARYLRVYPFQWHRSILMKIEILGCFVQYPEVTTISPEPTSTKLEKCSVCPGATLEDDACPCFESSGKYWDGEKCSARSQCPCFVGHISYPVGSVYYQTKDCSRCTCTFGGSSECSVQECPSCEEGKIAKRSPQCECLCAECDEGMKLCPTSNICIQSTSWCDGFVDCPDDELNCTTMHTNSVESTTPQSSTTVESKQLRCPPVECPPGFKIKLITSDNEESNNLEDLFSSQKSESTPAHSSKSKWGSHFNKHGRGFYGGGLHSGRRNSYWSNGQYSHHGNVYTSYHASRYHSHSYHGRQHGKSGFKLFKTHQESDKNIDSEGERCPEYECVPIKEDNKVCVTPVCTEGYDLVEVESVSQTQDSCPKYICKLTPLPDARCNITGRTFNTFDGLEFKYDVCDHVLAQSMTDANWQIRLIRTCSYIGPCKKSLKIKNFNNTIIFNTDMSVVYNGYDYTVEQCGKIGGQSLEFAIKKISDKFIIFKSILDFSVIWDMHGNVKIVIPHKLVGNVNGLCGLYDGDKENDRQKPDRTFAHSTIEFGDSWGNSESCETKVCPIEIQNKAWEMCMNVKKAPLAICGNVINVDKYLSQCVESICNCLEGQTPVTGSETVRVNTSILSTGVEKCKCDALLEFVTECQESNPAVDVSNWRIVNNCPVDCPAPFIYKECYNRICEMGCSDLMDDNPCPTSEGSCFPGCYCPDGLIKEKETCIKPLECQDCVCDGFGKTRYVTFDRADYTFNSNCTYKLVETVPEFNEGPKFTIVATTGLCDYENSRTESTCIKSLTFVYGVHSAQVGGLTTKDNYHKLYLKTNIGEKTEKFPYRNRWIDVQENNGNGLIIHLVTTHVKVLFYGRDKGFSIHMPSQLYFNNTQGLCGRCNRNETDDFMTSDGVVQTENIELFGKSWRAIGVSSIIGEEKDCDVIPQKEIECLPPPPDQDSCMKLLNGDIFGQCHAVIDPAPYVASCHESYCHDKGALDICGELQSYARECMSAGICVDWRSQLDCPHHCSEGLIYKPCTLGCLETCDNYNLLREKPEMCTDPKIEACVCPVGQVLLNSSCVLESRCQPCDTEGHYPGDVWHPDACTSCSCHSATAVHCRRTECPATAAILCQSGYRMVMQKGTEADCCPNFLCAPDNSLPEVMCNDTLPVRPDCGHGQKLKLEVDANGCEHYSCECKPASECEDTSTELNKIRNPGLVAVLVESGCCPEVKVICKKELCQQPPECDKFFVLHEVFSEAADACCPIYSCEPPKDKCLYEFEFIEEPNSGVRKRNPNERYTEMKSGGEVWYDGPCHKCECSSTDFKSHCTTKQCSLPTTDSVNYVVETMHIAGQCCPIFIRTACKVDDIVYQEGDVWRSPSGDPCKNYTCVKNEDGKITKQDIVETCKKDCRKGWKYVEPTVGSKECCGQCQPFACVIDDDREMSLNSVWYSEDNCTTYTCSAESDQVFISSSQQLCPPLEDCPEENIIKDGCCKRCNQTTPLAQSICAPESLPANETLKLIRHLDVKHGLCQNIEVLDAFTECRGTCDSYTYYNKDTESHDSKCQCCQAVKYDSIQVHLSCEDGSVMEKAVFVPAKCVCMACGA